MCARKGTPTPGGQGSAIKAQRPMVVILREAEGSASAPLYDANGRLRPYESPASLTETSELFTITLHFPHAGQARPLRCSTCDVRNTLPQPKQVTAALLPYQSSPCPRFDLSRKRTQSCYALAACNSLRSVASCRHNAPTCSASASVHGPRESAVRRYATPHCAVTHSSYVAIQQHASLSSGSDTYRGARFITAGSCHPSPTRTSRGSNRNRLRKIPSSTPPK